MDKRKKTLIKQDGELFLVWLNHPITKRKLKAGIYLKMHISIHLTCMQSYRRKLKSNAHRKNKYQFITENLPANVVAKVLVFKR